MSDQRVDQSFIRESWEDAESVGKYVGAVATVGLWESERKLIGEYVSPGGSLLDIGCGTGRTTFGVYEIGYRDIVGFDISAKMIEAARRIARERGFPIRFDVGDAASLLYADRSFDGALFSNQGLICIPGSERRLQALCEVRRILRPGAHFVFTTHDRDLPRHIEFWREERAKWSAGNQDPQLIEFGDRIIVDSSRPTYIHIPSRSEVEGLVADAGMELVEGRLRSEVAEEDESRPELNSECRMWVVRRPAGRPG